MLTKEARQKRIDELIEELFWCEKMIDYGGATEEELAPSFLELELELKRLRYKR